MTNDKSLPLVTVLIASYNHANYIRESILSVLNQTYKNIQLVVIDDGSIDSSTSVIDALAKQHPFEFISQKNAGLPVALNRGIALAKGKYFVSFGSDDIMMPDRIQKQVDWMEAHPSCAVCAGGIIEIDTKGQPLPKQRPGTEKDLTFDDIFAHRKGNIRAPTAMIRAEVLAVVGGYDPDTHLEDLYMWLKISSHGYPIHIMSDVLAYYRKHPTNNSANIVFMANSFISIYSAYSDRPDHKKIINHLLINLFYKACHHRFADAFAVLKLVSVRYYNLKVLRGLFKLLLKLHYAKRTN